MECRPAEMLMLLGTVLAVGTVGSSQHLNSVEKNGVFFSGLPRPDSELNTITEQDTSRNTPSRAGLPNKKLEGTNRQLTGTTPFDFRFNSAKPDNRFTVLRTTPRPNIAATSPTARTPSFITERRTTNRATTARQTLAPTTTRIPTQVPVRTPSRPVFSGATNQSPPRTTVTTSDKARATSGTTATQGTLSFSFRRASLTTGGNQSPPEVLKSSSPPIEDVSAPSDATQGTSRQPGITTGSAPPARPTTFFQGRGQPGSQRPLAPARVTTSPAARTTTVTSRSTGDRTSRIATESGPALGLSFTRIPSTNQGSRGPTGTITERRVPTRHTTAPSPVTQVTQRMPTTRRALPTLRSTTITGTETQRTQQTPLRFAFCDKVLCARSCRQRFGAKLNSSDCFNNACKCEVDEGCKPEACTARCRESTTNLRSAVCEDGTCKCFSRERCTSALCNDMCRRTHVGKEVLSASCQGDTCQCAIKKPCNLEECRRNCRKAQGNRLFSAECSDQDVCRCLHA